MALKIDCIYVHKYFQLCERNVHGLMCLIFDDPKSVFISASLVHHCYDALQAEQRMVLPFM